MHCVCAAAIVQGVLQQETVIRASNMLGRIYSSRLPLISFGDGGPNLSTA